MLESIITSKTRLNLLVKFFLNIANKGYLNSLANEFGESTNSVRKELNNLTSAGYLTKKEINNNSTLKQIEALADSPKLYQEFAMQNRLLPNAPDVIYGYFESLENKIIEIVKQS